MFRIKPALFLLYFTLQLLDVNAQGCSDAGICSAPTIRLTDTSVLSGDNKNTVTAGAVFGTAQYQVSSLGIYAEYVRRLGKVIVSGKVGYAFITGPLASNSGPADAVLTMAYSFNDRFTPMLGIKIPFTDANVKHGGLTLPMHTKQAWALRICWQGLLIHIKTGDLQWRGSSP